MAADLGASVARSVLRHARLHRIHGSIQVGIGWYRPCLLGRRYVGVVDALERANVRYLVAGGMAVNAQGFARLTKDLDLLIDLEPANGIRARDVFQAQGLQPRVPVSPRDLADPAKRDAWCERRKLLVFPWMDPSDPVRSVDVWIRNPIDFEQA